MPSSIRYDSVFHVPRLEEANARSNHVNRHVLAVNKIDESIVNQDGRPEPIWIVIFRIPAGSIIFKVAPEPNLDFAPPRPIKHQMERAI